MEKSDQTQEQQQQHAMGVVPGASQMDYSFLNQTVPLVASGIQSLIPLDELTNAVPTQPQLQAASSNFGHQFDYQKAQHFHHQQQQKQQQQRQKFQVFWSNQMKEIEKTVDFKNVSLPLARIKKIMQADEDVRMISVEALVVFAKACEIFTLELTSRSFIYAEENKRKLLQKSDIATAIAKTYVFDFLIDIFPEDEFKEEGLGITPFAMPMMGAPADPPQHPVGQAALYSNQQLQPPVDLGHGIALSAMPIMGAQTDLPYYDIPTQHPVGPTGRIMGNPVDQAALYSNQHAVDPTGMIMGIPVDQAALYSNQQPKPPVGLGHGIAPSAMPIMGAQTDLPYYDIPPQHTVGPTGMIMGSPVDQAAVYSNQQHVGPTGLITGNPVDQATVYSNQQHVGPTGMLMGNPVDQAAVYSNQQHVGPKGMLMGSPVDQATLSSNQQHVGPTGMLRGNPVDQTAVYSNQQHVGPTGMLMGNPVDQAAVYSNQQHVGPIGMLMGNPVDQTTVYSNQQPVGPTGRIMGNAADQAAVYSNQQRQPPVDLGHGIAPSAMPMMGTQTDLPYYDIPPQHTVGPTGMIMGSLVDQEAVYSNQHHVGHTGMIMGNPDDQALLYSNQQPQPAVFKSWPNPHPSNNSHPNNNKLIHKF